MSFEEEFKNFEDVLIELAPRVKDDWRIDVSGIYGEGQSTVNYVNRISIHTGGISLRYAAITILCDDKWENGKRGFIPRYSRIKQVIDCVKKYMDLPIRYGHTFYIDFPDAKYPFSDLIGGK